MAGVSLHADCLRACLGGGARGTLHHHYRNSRMCPWRRDSAQLQGGEASDISLFRAGRLTHAFVFG